MWDDEVTTTCIDQRRQLDQPFKPNNCDWVPPAACSDSGRMPLRVLRNECAPVQASTVPASHHSCSNSPMRQVHSTQGSSIEWSRSLSTSPARRHSKVSAVKHPRLAQVPDPGSQSHASGAEVGTSDEGASAASASAASFAGMEVEKRLPAPQDNRRRQALPNLEFQSQTDHQPVPLLQSATGESEALQQQQQQQGEQHSAAGAATAAEARIRELKARLTRQQEDFRRVLAEEVDVQVALQTCVTTSYPSSPSDFCRCHVKVHYMTMLVT